MKKILAIILAIVLVAMNVVAVAATDYTKGQNPNPAATEEQTINVKKSYNVNGADAETPEHKVEFKISGTVSNITAFDVADASSTLIGTSSSTTKEAPEVFIGAKDGESKNKITVTKGATSITMPIILPVYSYVGIYEYTIDETPVFNDVAGVTYKGASEQYTLRVTVTQEGKALKVTGIALRAKNGAKNQKTDTFENIYNAGTLEIEKTVSGNMGDRQAVWDFTVTFKAPEGKKVYSDIYYTTTYVASEDSSEETEETPAAETTTTETPTTETPTTETPTTETPATETPTTETPGETKQVAVSASTAWDGTKTYNFKLKHGDTIKFTNIPDGVTYKIVETQANKDGYTTTYTDEKGTIAKDDESTDYTAKIENNKGITPDTGVILDSAPYMLILALAAAFILVDRRRKIFVK